MSNNQRRQELYDRIRESSMDEVTLEEMVRHGFWTPGKNLPKVTEDLIKRRGELQRELNVLSRDASKYLNAERALKQIMKDRMRTAKLKRIETKRQQATDRNQRAADWYDKRTKDIVHLGQAHTPALQNRDDQPERLAEFGLPQFADMNAIAGAMGVDLGELRFLAYDRPASKVTHYARFQIPKKTGGFRQVSAPMPRMKRAQCWVLDNILNKLTPHEAAHGFRSERSILTNAEPHVKQAIVMNYDLKDFFPSVEYKRVKGLFNSFGYSEAQATLFGLLMTEADRTQVEMDGETWHVASSARTLPQGAPTSPAITNLLCRKLDRRLEGVARKLGFTYTRYADDLTFSRSVDDAISIQKLDWSVKKIITDEGFILNAAKTRVMRRHQRQEVTGITVNDGLSISRQERRKFRAYLHQKAKGNISESFRNGSPKNSALGYAQFLDMVHGQGRLTLSDQARNLFGAPTKPPFDLDREKFRKMSAQGEAPSETWWTPAVPKAPIPESLPEFPPIWGQANAEQSSGVQTSSHRSGDWRSNQDSRQSANSRTQENNTQTAQFRKGNSWGLARKIWVSILLALVFIPIPFTGILFGIAIYYIWFKKYEI